MTEQTKIRFRAVTTSTNDTVAAILAYAKSPHLKELRLAVTQAYRYEVELKGADNNLLQNSPILQAVAVLALPYVPGENVTVVIDSSEISAQRSARASELKGLLGALLALNLAPGKLTYSLTPVVATNHLAVAEAEQAILGTDYAQLATAADEDDLLQRMQYKPS
ncbi:hypothetical protein [Paraburkholderia dioscoreae]|uniref:Uncharacterized protein n=1 Tax=Paraburkholderia dioscoreae TaxID=2604047 RepID=A0A5Q4YWN9_9BURK|nr:hypothetical protein [Paraburkholderia dioscoreae]VVD30912.1 conserved protein of unknown function [Paraburkholderia dioscoreae]